MGWTGKKGYRSRDSPFEIEFRKKMIDRFKFFFYTRLCYVGERETGRDKNVLEEEEKRGTGGREKIREENKFQFV